MAADRVLFDACCLLNLSATGSLERILVELPYLFSVGRRAKEESLWLRDPDSGEREPIDLSPSLERGLLREEQLQVGKETELFVEFAPDLDDGEAEAAAIAVARSYALATDDAKARRILPARSDALRLYSTLELVQGWQRAATVPDHEITEALRRIGYRASYRPRRSDPLWDWWVSLIGEGRAGGLDGTK